MIIVWQGMTEVLDPVTKQKIRCFKVIRCTGATGIFQRHNFEGLWFLSQGEEVSEGHAHYEHRTPNGQVVHLFHVNSTYGGGPRWVMGPVAGNENGWAFVDTSATHPEMIRKEWEFLMESSWEVCPLFFRGVIGGGAPLEDDYIGRNDIDSAKKKESSQAAVKRWQALPSAISRQKALESSARGKPVVSSRRPSSLNYLQHVLKAQSSPKRRPSGVPSTVRRSSTPPPAPPGRSSRVNNRRPSLKLPQGRRPSLGRLGSLNRESRETRETRRAGWETRRATTSNRESRRY